MRALKCNHCANEITAQQSKCPHCGMPLKPQSTAQNVVQFKRWFFTLVVLCAGVIYWLPPNWSGL